jgi:hypothetical protein
LSFLWQGRVEQLATLGCSNAGANAINNRGELAGFAENGIRDPVSSRSACKHIGHLVLDYEAVIWAPICGNGKRSSGKRNQ